MVSRKNIEVALKYTPEAMRVFWEQKYNGEQSLMDLAHRRDQAIQSDNYGLLNTIDAKFSLFFRHLEMLRPCKNGNVADGVRNVKNYAETLAFAVAASQADFDAEIYAQINRVSASGIDRDAVMRRGYFMQKCANDLNALIQNAENHFGVKLDRADLFPSNDKTRAMKPQNMVLN